MMYDATKKERIKLEKLGKLVDDFSKRIDALKPYDQIDIEPPKDENIIYIPIEGKFDKAYFARMFLLRKHTVYNRIISRFDMIQYQIPVNAFNEELILLLFGKHALNRTNYVSDDLLLNPFFTFCKDVDERVFFYCKTIKLYYLAEAIIEEFTFEDNNYNVSQMPAQRIVNRLELDLQLSELFRELQEKHYQNKIRLEQWIIKNCDIAYNEYKASSISAVNWASEFKLYQLIKLWYPDAVFQYKSNWLNGQSIDIYIPSKKAAIEHQGQQHYEPVAYFGGKKGLLNNIDRDLSKLRKCLESGVSVFYWIYRKKITFSSVAKFLGRKQEDVRNELTKGLPFPVSDILINPSFHEKPDEAKEKEHICDILCFSHDGQLLARYKSINNAAESTGISTTSIQKCLSGQRKTSGGYHWIRENPDGTIPQIDMEEFDRHINKDNTGLSKPVAQIDIKTGEVICVFGSIGKAAESVGINRCGISDVLKGKQKTAGGYYWKLLKE